MGVIEMTMSQDLRIRLVNKVASGKSCRRAAAHFEVSASSAIRFNKQYETEGSVAPKTRAVQKRRLATATAQPDGEVRQDITSGHIDGNGAARPGDPGNLGRLYFVFSVIQLHKCVDLKST